MSLVQNKKKSSKVQKYAIWIKKKPNWCLFESTRWCLDTKHGLCRYVQNIQQSISQSQQKNQAEQSRKEKKKAEQERQRELDELFAMTIKLIDVWVWFECFWRCRHHRQFLWQQLQSKKSWFHRWGVLRSLTWCVLDFQDAVIIFHNATPPNTIGVMPSVVPHRLPTKSLAERVLIAYCLRSGHRSWCVC